MIGNILTSENWNTAYYKNDELKSFISFQITPGQEYPQYFSVVTNQNDETIIENAHESLQKACQFLNQKYQKLWEFHSMLIEQKSGGCSTCVAH